MADRVPITLFVNIRSVSVHASWSDPLNPSDPWTGYPYQWTVSLRVQPQPHSDPSTPRPFTYNGLDISIGDWVIFSSSALALQIVSIVAQTDSNLTVIVEDVSLYNILSDPSQTGQGIGPISPQGVFDCLIVRLNPSGIPVFSAISDYSVPINLISDITNRFQFRNYVQDYIPGSQPGHDFSIGDVIYIDQDGSYRKSISTDPGAEVSIGTITSIDQPNVGDFTYRPLGRYVTNLPTLPGNPGQVLYVSDSVPGGLTPTPPSPIAIPVYIKISNTSGILTSGGTGGGAAGNISIVGNTIAATNTDGNINLQPNGSGTVNAPSANIGALVTETGRFTSLTPGRVVIVGPDGSLVDTGYFTFDIPGSALSVGNVKVASDFITTVDDGIPLVLTTGGNANVQVAATLDLNANRIVNVLDPLEGQDVATKSYVDAVASGLSTKEAVHVATGLPLNATYTPSVAYGSLTANVYERLVIDDIEPEINSRILVKNQIDERENGIYRVVQIGSPGEPWLLSRTADFNGQGVAGEIRSGDFVFVEVGTVYGGTGWVMTSPNPVTVNVSDIRWTQFSSAGVIQAGFGLTKTGTVLDVNVAAIIDKNTGLNATPGPTGNKIIEIHLSSNTPLEFDLGALRVKSSIAGTGLSYDLVAGNISVNADQPTITGLGNIVSGTWSAGVISTQYGGTGLSAIGLAAQVLAVNDAGTGLEYAYRSKLTEGSFPPYYPQPADGDRWFNTDTGIMFTRITDDTGSHWIEL
jgi:hypothetical protein